MTTVCLSSAMCPFIASHSVRMLQVVLQKGSTFPWYWMDLQTVIYFGYVFILYISNPYYSPRKFTMLCYQYSCAGL